MVGNFFIVYPEGIWLRVNADGSADGANFNFTYAKIVVEDIAIQPDGKILFGGGDFVGLQVSRFNANKTSDTTFGNNGVATAFFSSGATGNGMVLQNDGKIVVGGYTLLV